MYLLANAPKRPQPHGVLLHREPRFIGALAHLTASCIAVRNGAPALAELPYRQLGDIFHGDILAVILDILHGQRSEQTARSGSRQLLGGVFYHDNDQSFPWAVLPRIRVERSSLRSAFLRGAGLHIPLDDNGTCGHLPHMLPRQDAPAGTGCAACRRHAHTFEP